MSSSDRSALHMAPIDKAASVWRKASADEFATEQARQIFQAILPVVLGRFVDKNADYGDETAAFLGAKGQFADINPKFWKLKRALWDDQPLNGESVEEILSDLIGHCLLTLHFLSKAKPESFAPRDAPPLPHNHAFDEDCRGDCPLADAWKKS